MIDTVVVLALCCAVLAVTTAFLSLVCGGVIAHLLHQWGRVARAQAEASEARADVAKLDMVVERLCKAVGVEAATEGKQ